jgi:chromosome segregation ATPase
MGQLQEAQSKVTDLESQLKRAKDNSAVLESQLAKTIGLQSQDNGMVQQITQQF